MDFDTSYGGIYWGREVDQYLKRCEPSADLVVRGLGFEFPWRDASEKSDFAGKTEAFRTAKSYINYNVMQLQYKLMQCISR